MNTLSFPGLLKRIAFSKPLAACLAAYREGKFPLEIEGSEGALGALLLAAFYETRPGSVFAVVPQESDAADLALDLAAAGISARLFPWWGAVPYREMPLPSAVFGERTAILADLALNRPGIVIIPERAFLTPLPPPDYTKSLLLSLKPGGRIDTASLARTLASYGYIRTPRVQVHGEFALRGEVLDIFMGGDDEARRVLFDFDQVESIKRFDPVNQGSVGERGKEKLSELLIRPMKEVVWTDERIEKLGENLAALEEFPGGGRVIIEELISRRTAPGEEMFYPLAFGGAGKNPKSPERDSKAILRPSSLLDYLGPGGTLVLFDRERLENAREILNREYRSLYNHALRAPADSASPGAAGSGSGGRSPFKKDRPPRELPLPERLLFDFSELVKGRERLVFFKNLKKETEPGVFHFAIPCDPPRSFFGNINYLKDEFAALLSQKWEIVVAAESEVQAARITELLKDEAVTVIPSPISAGFSLPDIRLCVIQENEIFGRRKRPPRSLRTVRSSPIDTFVELNPGDFVVHVNYGIGLFKGIERIKALGNERDYVKLEYEEEEFVFVPIEQVNLVQRYIGSEGAPPRLDRLGSKSWENRKGRVKKSVEDIAEKLLELYSRRKQAVGFVFPRDTEWQTMFEAAFPFEETEDQLRCVEEIKADMESPQPMDRLVCGDVGYGKTEVAVRACFKAIMGGRQVAFLAPTTILAEQHYENFQERFSQFPVRLAMLSRCVAGRRTRESLEQLKKGEIDILIGTHRIIQKDLEFKRLGLMVIDEEQRFGVRDKERLKDIKTNVDCLSLSATPIPRTLHMSLLKIRDMSLLATPPQNRHPIETVIGEYNDERLAQAIRREAERGGQVFFLHNRIETLRETRMKIERLVPEMLVETAHGRMDAQALEDVMHRFIHGGFHVLVSTTIIENGIDIPNVNTIIIDRADMYGV
ncbi:MAG: DEAD/DEAH box helicase, partial [Treponema sp.]|nr:DEAD/DEAH box helicase [Treponema sp.]